VTVFLSGVQDANTNDSVAMLSPPDADPTKTAPIKFMRGEQLGENYTATGEATIRFWVNNMHADVAFVFYKNFADQFQKTQHLKFAGQSNVVVVQNHQQPNQGHLALTGKDGEMRVTWTSGRSRTPQYVYVGTASGRFSRRVPARAHRYTPEDMCGSPAKDYGWREPGWIYTAVVDRLVPGRQYYFKFGSDSAGKSPESCFTAPGSAESKENLHFLVVADMGKGEIDGTNKVFDWQHNSVSTMIGLQNHLQNAEMVYHIGDVAYAEGYGSQWDEYMEEISPVALVVPWMTLPGNHEVDWSNSTWLHGDDSGGECGVPYTKRFPMPLVNDTVKSWYSFDLGPVHFLSFSTEEDYTAGSEQLAWMHSDLASVDRQKTPWIVVSGHRPMYTVDEQIEPDAPRLLRQHVEPLFDTYRVDVSLWGHYHSYARTCPIFREKCRENSTIHIVAGMSGFNLDQDPIVVPEYILVEDNKNYGFLKVNVTRDVFLIQYLNNDGVVLDHVQIEK